MKYASPSTTSSESQHISPSYLPQPGPKPIIIPNSPMSQSLQPPQNTQPPQTSTPSPVITAMRGKAGITQEQATKAKGWI